MTHRTRRISLLFVALAAASLLLVIGDATGLPAGAPKVGMVCAPGIVNGSTHTFNLTTGSGSIQTPDGNNVFMWSYADRDDAKASLQTFQYPGPVLCATQGETVVVNLTNPLPEASSIVFPGQDAEVTPSGGTPGLLTREAAASGGTVSYSFVAQSPGTYLYESGTDISKQVEMGLYGALIVRPTMGLNFAYNNAQTQFDPAREHILLLGEIDPDLHHAVEVNGTYDFTTLHNRYFTVNGRSFPDTIQDNASALFPTQPYGALVRIQPNDATHTQPGLIRMLNAGADNHPFHPHGNHTREIAQDGRLLLSPGGARASTEHFGETIGAGQTLDYLLRWDNQSTDTTGNPFDDRWDPNTNPLPVGPPNYLNVTFKDSTTWYSGSPYLGYKGTLPTGTNSLNICGEWYFPLHSHALNEFTNFDEGFGGMGTLLRVDPLGGCFTSPSSSNLVGGVLKSGSVTALAVDDGSYYQINPKTTTLAAAAPLTTLSAAITTAGQGSISVSSKTGFPTTFPFYVQIDNEFLQVTGSPTPSTWSVTRGALGSTATTHASGAQVLLASIRVGSASGFPAAGAYYVRVNNEVLRVFGGQGTTTWTVERHVLGSTAASQPSGATVTALATDWFSGFSGVTVGSQNLKITYKGENCGSTTGSTCAALTTNLPLQTTKICDWTISGAAGCSSATSNGWVPLPAPQSIAVGSTDVSTTWTLSGSGANYIGTGSSKGQVRVLVHTQRWTATSPTPFSTWGNFMRLVYDAP